MKILMLSLLLVLSLNTFAEDQDDPSTFCDQNSDCTDRMREIAANYKVGNNNFSKESLVGYSGGCFHISSMYYPDHEHHGSFIFRKDGDALLTTGIFSFFADQDPYQNMNSVELNNWFIQQGSRFDKATVVENSVQLQYLTDDSNYKYWFRSNADQSKLSLIARQMSGSYLGFIFCDMNRR